MALAGCGSSVKPAAVPNRSAASATTTAGGATRGQGATGAGSPGATAPPRGSPASTAPPTAAPGGSSAQPPADAPPSPGTYSYTQQGSFSALGQSQSFPPQGTDVIDPASAQGAGSWTQVWHTYVSSSQPPDDTTFAITPAAVSITSEVIRMAAGGQTITFSCSFASPVQILDWPPTVGHRFSGSATCSSPNNGSFSVSVSGNVSGTQSTSIGGAATTAYVVSTTVTTSGSVVSSSTETDWFDPVSRLDLYTKSQENGTYNGIKFSSEDTRTLVSTHPG